MRVLAAYLAHGGIKETAAALGMTRSAVRHVLEDVRGTLGCTTEQAIAIGVLDGWLPFERPKGNSYRLDELIVAARRSRV